MMNLTLNKILFVACSLFTMNTYAADFKILKLNESTIGKVSLALGKTTVLSFPMRPSKVILGNQGSFAVQYVENDIAISPTRVGARSNLFVYVASRRFGFDLITGPMGDSIISIHDLESEPPKGKK